MEGSFFWRAPEGDDISLVYTAGEAGYLAEGDHLPVSPEVPAAPEMVLPMMVDFTPEVAAARSSFLEKFNEAKMKAEEEAVKLDASKVTFNDVNVKGSSSNFIKKKTIERNCDAVSKTEFKFNFSPPENQS